LIKFKEVAKFDLDDTKSRFLVLEAGYRYITAPDALPEDHLLTAATLNLPLRAGLHVSDRNRADLDWKNGMFTWDIETNLPSIGLFRSIPTPDPVRRWRRVLRKPTRQMEYSAVFVFFVSGWNTRPIQRLLRIEEQHR